MLAFLSPAKNIRPCKKAGLALTCPAFAEQAKQLVQQLREMETWELESLFRVNPTIALRAFLDYRDFDSEKDKTAAILSFHGLAYQHLNAADFTTEELAFAQNHLRILSALYGALRPCDGILPYRLEFLCRWKPEGKSLYDFWSDQIHRSLFAAGEVVVNLASGEYAKTVIPFLQPGDRLITCDFLTQKRGKLQMLAALAKMARGEMARFIVKERAELPEDLKRFQWDGYAFSEALSGPEKYVFVRSAT